MSDEALQADTPVGAGHVDALGIGGASVGTRALVDIDAAMNQVHLVATGALAPEAAHGVDALRVVAAGGVASALVHVC